MNMFFEAGPVVQSVKYLDQVNLIDFGIQRFCTVIVGLKALYYARL